LDIRNYTWVDTFEPFTPSTTTSSVPPTPSNHSTLSKSSTPSNPSISSNSSTQTSTDTNDQLMTMKIAITAMGGIFVTAILMTIGFFGYKKYKNRQIERQSEVLRIHGNHGNFRHR
jgi:hypothetical protein